MIAAAGISTTLEAPVGGIGTGSAVSDMLNTAGAQTAGYEWVHGPSLRPFEPHVDLDGIQFESFDAEALANHGDWPDNAYFMPGDHDGCLCDFMPIWMSPEEPSAPTLTMGDPGPDSGYSDEDRASMQQALSDAVARSPELATGEGGVRPLASVSYSSNALTQDQGAFREGALTANRAGEAVENHYCAACWPGTVQTSYATGTAQTIVRSPMSIIVNDSGPYAVSNTVAIQDAYGTMTHEIGHAFFDSRGIDSFNTAAWLTNMNGIGPDEAAQISIYAASDPREALAEMYSLKYTPGYSLPADIASKFDAIETAVRPADGSAKLSTQTEWLKMPATVPRPGSEAEAATRAAAAANIAAGKWVASGSDEPSDSKQRDKPSEK